MPPFNVMVDTNPPRATFTRKVVGGNTQYTAVVEDFNLGELDLGADAECNIIEDQPENISAAWYQAIFGRVTPVYRRTVTCRVAGEEISRQLTACDTAGNCAVVDSLSGRVAADAAPPLSGKVRLASAVAPSGQTPPYIVRLRLTNVPAIAQPAPAPAALLALAATGPGSGPGGVGSTDGTSSLKLWLKADAGTYTDLACATATNNGNAVACWADQSGNGRNLLQSTGGDQPTYQTNVQNGRPSLAFDSSDFLEETGVLGSDLFSADSTSAIFVIKPTSVNEVWFNWQSVEPTNRVGFESSAAKMRFDLPNDTTGRLASASSITDAFHIIIGHKTAVTQTIYIDGGTDVSQTNALTLTVTDPAPLVIGKYQSSWRGLWTGGLPEVMVYNTALNTAQRTLVENYLGARYALIIANDVYTGNDAAYIQDVAGIGLEADGNNAVARSAGLVISNSAFLADSGDYLIAGHNALTITTTTADLPVGVDSRWTRVWYLDKTDVNSNNGAVTLAFDFSDSGLGGSPAGMYHLLQRAGTAGAFSSVMTSTTFSGDQVIFTLDASSLSDSYYTLGETAPPNAPPTAVGDAAATNEDTPVTINVLSNDSDPDGDPLAIGSVGLPTNGVVTISNTQSLIYTPTLNFNGADVFTYTATDGSLSDAAIVTVTVNPVNDAPAAVDDTATTTEDTPLTISVLSNDSDPDGDPLAIGSVGLPTNGVVTISNTQSLIYTPTLGFIGTDVFTYTASDGSLSDTATVTVTVNPPPVSGLFIIQPALDAVFTTTAPISVTGIASSTAYLKSLTVAVDSTLIYSQSWASGALMQTSWAASWTPAGDGPHEVEAVLTSWSLETIRAVLTFTVDATPPEVSFDTADLVFDSTGRVAVSGRVTDTGGIAEVTFDVHGPVPQTGLPVILSGPPTAAQWSAEWRPGSSAPLDGAVYTFTVHATDRYGHQTQAGQPFAVDVIAPEISQPAITLNDAAARPGQVIDTATMTATVSFTVADGSGVNRAWYGWLDGSGAPVSVQDGVVALIDATHLTTVANPGPAPLNFTTYITAETDGAAHYLYLGALDNAALYRERVIGPFYQDTPGLPAFLGENPFTGKPHLDWLEQGCALVGSDERLPGSGQSLFLTRDNVSLALVWRGANWDTAGDLFIYLDTIPDEGDMFGTPYVRHGGNAAYNPYTATNPSTLMLLPVREWESWENATRTPAPFNAMNADYGVWVKDSATAILLRWDNALSQWVEDGPLPLFGSSDSDPAVTGSYFFDPGLGQSLAWVSLPITTVATGTLTTLSLAAFAVEEDALRLWAVAPADNPVNSSLVVRQTTPVSQPLRLMLEERFNLELDDGGCLHRLGGFRSSLLSQHGVSHDFNDDSALLLAGSGLDDSVYAGYDGPYNAWLTNTFCAAPENQQHPACRDDKPPAPIGLDVLLAGLKDTDHPPLQPGQVVSYSFHYHNDTPEIKDVWLEMAGPLNWANACNLVAQRNPATGVTTPFNIPPYTEGSLVFTASVGLQTVDTVTATVRSGATTTGVCSIAGPDTGILGVLQVHHKADTAGPGYISLVQPTTIISQNQVMVSGVVVDESPVKDISLQVQAPGGGSTTLSCVDDTPGDGSWACPWDVTATNGGLPPTDGETFQLRARATDPFGQSSEWTHWHELVVDTAPPTLTLNLDLQTERQAGRVTLDRAASSLPVLGTGQTYFSGQLFDNRLVTAVEICDAAGENCQQADLTVDPAGIPQTAFTYYDVSTATIPINAVGQAQSQAEFPTLPETCGPGSIGIWRQFTISDTFTIANLEVGLAVAHPYRTDLLVRLWSPGGESVTLLDNANRILAQNYNVSISPNTAELAHTRHLDHALGEPYFANVLLPVDSFDALRGTLAAGVWTLLICDTEPTTDEGAYHRARLSFTANVAPQDTEANWFFSLPNVDGKDGKDVSYTLYGLDSLGNRTAGQAVTVLVDTVAPVITATQLLNSFILTDTATVLSGTVSDGSGIVSVYATVMGPAGSLEIANAGYAGGAWTFDLEPSDTGTYLISINALDEGNNMSTAGPFEVNVTLPGQLQHDLFLPLILKAFSPPPIAPDLVVSSLVATADGVQVVIKNQGTAPVTDEFWVDAYIDPRTPPTAVNQPWDTLGDEGLVWAVVAPALPLEPGSALTLTLGDAYYQPDLSQITLPLAAGMPVYAQVNTVRIAS
ncbi:MAG: Ig-like domain-containing protein [Anaerolineae bacterium]